MEKTTYVEIDDMIREGIEPFTLVCDTVYDCTSGNAYAYRTSLLINSVNYGALSENEYGPIAERSKRGILLSEKAICDALRSAEGIEGEYQWISARCHEVFITRTDPLDEIKRIVPADMISKLCLEFPSKLLFSLNGNTVNKLMALKNAGIKLLLRDFGDELCPTMKLASFPFDYVSLHPQITYAMRKEESRVSAELLIAFVRGLKIGMIVEELVSKYEQDTVSKLGIIGFTRAHGEGGNA